MVVVLYGSGQDTKGLYLGVHMALNGVSHQLNKSKFTNYYILSASTSLINNCIRTRSQF